MLLLLLLLVAAILLLSGDDGNPRFLNLWGDPPDPVKILVGIDIRWRDLLTPDFVEGDIVPVLL